MRQPDNRGRSLGTIFLMEEPVPKATVDGEECQAQSAPEAVSASKLLLETRILAMFPTQPRPIRFKLMWPRTDGPNVRLKVVIEELQP